MAYILLLEQNIVNIWCNYMILNMKSSDTTERRTPKDPKNEKISLDSISPGFVAAFAASIPCMYPGLTTEKSGSAPGWANAARGAVKAMTRPANTAIATGTPVGAPVRSSGASAEAGVNDLWLRGGVTETKLKLLREPAASKKLADKAARSAAERTMASGRPREPGVKIQVNSLAEKTQ